MNAKQAVLDIFFAGVNRVKPDQLIHKSVEYSNNILTIGNHSINLQTLRDLYVIGAGKASASMAKELELILGNRIKDGFIVTKYDHAVPLKNIRIKEAGHPVPDENGLEGTKEILKIANKAGAEDLVICLLSGGGSALLVDLPEGCTLNDLAILNTLLLESGATINEMNCVRKHLSGIKGGQLTRAAWPAQTISLILSDVIGDRLDVIASGPTAPDPTTFSDAIGILTKYKIKDNIPESLLKVLNQGLQKKKEETLKENDEIFQRNTNLVIGSNSLCLETAKEKARSMGFSARVITNSLEGDISKVADFITEEIQKSINSEPVRPICLLFGGEPTLKVDRPGKGGRNQHLALIMAQKLKDTVGVTFLSGGTDGTDGPTDAAGAIIDSATYTTALKKGIDIDQYLANFDSYHFFKKKEDTLSQVLLKPM